MKYLETTLKTHDQTKLAQQYSSSGHRYIGRPKKDDKSCCEYGRNVLPKRGMKTLVTMIYKKGDSKIYFLSPPE